MNKLIHAPKRTKEQRERDLAFISKLYVKGFTLTQIMVELNKYVQTMGDSYDLTIHSISYDVKQIQEDWKKAKFETIQEHIMLELIKLDTMEQELWQAWERSKGKRVKVRLKNSEYIEQLTDIKGKTTTQQSIETLNGDPRYMDIMLRIMDKRAKLLGYDKPDMVVLVDRTEDKKEKFLESVPEKIIKELTDHLLMIGDRQNSLPESTNNGQ